MEPRQEGRLGGLERQPLRTGERGSAVQPEMVGARGYEVGSERSFEMENTRTETPQNVMPALPVPVLPQPAAAGSQQVADDASTPSVAGDDDLIEKEWVDKAKKIIADTQDDPYRREKEISRLQIEYIRKRYGREIGESSD